MKNTLTKSISFILMLALALSMFTACKPSASARVYIEGTSFMVDGKELWLSGGNTPWYDWNDFTGNMNEEKWENTFATLAENNINCTRIWVNCNGYQIVKVNSSGDITEINPDHWTDLDKLFALAEKYGVYIMATLLSFDHFKSPNWQALISSKEKADAYADMYVEEFCRRYGENEYLFAIDIMNEPDWVYENEECGQIEWDNISYLLGKCASAIHDNCDTLVTVGMGIIKYNSDKYEGNKISDKYLTELTGLDTAYVDFYSTHYYHWQKPYFNFPFDKTPEDFGLDNDKPCLIGETSNDNERQFKMTLPELYKSVYENGWNGILVWMEPRQEEETIWYRFDLTAEATNEMADYIFDKIYPIGKKK